MKRAVISTVKRGKQKGEFTFKLIAANNEVVAQSYPETYKDIDKAKQTLENHFPDFSIVEESLAVNDKFIIIED